PRPPCHSRSQLCPRRAVRVAGPGGVRHPPHGRAADARLLPPRLRHEGADRPRPRPGAARGPDRPANAKQIALAPVPVVITARLGGDRADTGAGRALAGRMAGGAERPANEAVGTSWWRPTRRRG